MTPDSGSAFLDALADEFLRRHRRGERPRIAHYIERYPEHADGIREVFPALVMLESIAKGPRHRSRYSLLAGVRRPEILGDYRILQEVGQGGMGIVYEAEQISLGRHVALKVLPFQLAGNPRAVQRFQREARAAANLQHPHIVPVFDFGQEESVWYYAMQFVHGQPVSDVLEEVRKLQGVEAFDLARWAGQTTDLAVTLIEGDFEGGDVPLESARGGAGAKSVFEADSADHREARIREIVDDCLVRSERGESVCHEDIVRQHPNLQPELEEELHMLRLVQASRLPSFVEDLAAMEARWAPPKERTETARAEDAQAPHGRTSEVGQSSSALKLTGEDDLAPAGRKQYYFHSVARLGAAVAGALAYAHEQGVIHRDVKPSNLMLDTRGHVWITDFGLAKLDDTKLTSTRGFVGTLRYMAPEQMQGRADERSDVYGLGMTLYEMLTLKLPFEDLDQLEVIHQACHRGPKPPREIDPAIPRDLETIVLTAIARDPVDRYPTARGLAEDLARFLEDQPIAAKRCGRITRAWKWLEVHVVGCFLTGRLLGGASPHTDSAQVAELHSRVRELEAEISKLQLRLKGGRDVDTDRAESVSASLEQVGKSDDRTRK